MIVLEQADPVKYNHYNSNYQQRINNAGKVYRKRENADQVEQCRN
jgi:hypothetical protein